MFSWVRAGKLSNERHLDVANSSQGSFSWTTNVQEIRGHHSINRKIHSYLYFMKNDHNNLILDLRGPQKCAVWGHKPYEYLASTLLWTIKQYRTQLFILTCCNQSQFGKFKQRSESRATDNYLSQLQINRTKSTTEAKCERNVPRALNGEKFSLSYIVLTGQAVHTEVGNYYYICGLLYMCNEDVTMAFQ